MPRKSISNIGIQPVRAMDVDRLPPREQRTYIWVVFSKGDKNAPATAFAGLNGEFFNYPRGQKCLVPKEVLEGCFGNAVERVIETYDDNTYSETEQAAFPYQTYGEATPEQVAEYFAQTFDQVKA